jgi:hypothetical protein
MFLPPTMLPHDLRVLVDPPVQFPDVLDTPLQPVSSSRGPLRRSSFSRTRPGRTTPGSVHGRPDPCTD